MPRFSPFPAITFADTDRIESLAAPPYDVISAATRKVLAADPHNLVHVSLPQPPGDPEAYRRAGALFREWLRTGALVTENQPCVYLYGSSFDTDAGQRSMHGLIGALELVPFGEADVYPHERTNPGPKADRLSLMRTTEANLEPLWFFTARPMAGYTDLIAEASGHAPIIIVTTAGVKHAIWRLPDDLGEQAARMVSAAPLVVADGHHRYETSVAYRDDRRATDGPGAWDATLALVMDVAVDPPPVLPIHRLVEGVEGSALAAALGPASSQIAQIAELERKVALHGPGMVAVCTSEASWTVELTAELDTAALADKIGELGASVSYEHAIEEVAAHVSKGGVGVLMAPVRLETVAEMALRGVRMPPKTTLFWPKPLSGLLMRELRT